MELLSPPTASAAAKIETPLAGDTAPGESEFQTPRKASAHAVLERIPKASCSPAPPTFFDIRKFMCKIAA